MEFEYNNQKVALNTIEVSDIGNFAIEASNDEGYFFYMIVITLLGKTWIHTFGPLIPDINMLMNNYSSYSFSFDYNEKKIEKAINNWLNDKKNITSAKIIDRQEALDMIPDLRALIESTD